MKVLHIGWGFRPWRIGGLLEYAEDLMDMQVAQGYEVGYFFSGRHYPLPRKPWLKKWLRKSINMYEIINSYIDRKYEQVTHYPEVDLNEDYSEIFFLRVLSEFGPDVIHIQELFGMPSSLIEIIKIKNIPVLMTLQDYFPLCPTLKLFDYKNSLCLKPNIEDTCKICYSQEIRRHKHYIELTLHYESQKSLLIKLLIITFNKLRQLKHLMYLSLQKFYYNKNSNYQEDKHKTTKEYSLNKSKKFQNRRDTNVERLNKIDLLIAQSFRVAEIYRTLGVEEKKVTVVHLTVRHIDQIKPKSMKSISYPINIATMNGLASSPKGAYLILDALHKLKSAGLSSQFTLSVMGHILDSIKDELLQFENVVYKGTYDVNNLTDLLEQIHVGIVPSVWEEAYGYVGIEFLAKGIPVIGNKIGGIVDYTADNVTGWLNKANTAEGLAQIVTDIIRNPNQILHLNRNIMSNYHQIMKSMDRHFEEMDKIYRELIQRGKG